MGAASAALLLAPGYPRAMMRVADEAGPSTAVALAMLFRSVAAVIAPVAAPHARTHADDAAAPRRVPPPALVFCAGVRG